MLKKIDRTRYRSRAIVPLPKTGARRTASAVWPTEPSSRRIIDQKWVGQFRADGAALESQLLKEHSMGSVGRVAEKPSLGKTDLEWEVVEEDTEDTQEEGIRVFITTAADALADYLNELDSISNPRAQRTVSNENCDEDLVRATTAAASEVFTSSINVQSKPSPSMQDHAHPLQRIASDRSDSDEADAISNSSAQHPVLNENCSEDLVRTVTADTIVQSEPIPSTQDPVHFLETTANVRNDSDDPDSTAYRRRRLTLMNGDYWRY